MSKKNEIRDWVIYKITSPSGRIYIGKTVNFKQRIRQYRCKYKNGNQRLLESSFKKYGFDSHNIEEIDRFESNVGYSSGKEMFWIRSYMSNESRWGLGLGLNLTDGGEGQCGRQVTHETRGKMRDAHKNRTVYAKGWKHSEEYKLKMSTERKGILFGVRKKWTDEQKKKMSEIKKGCASPNKGKKYNHLSDEERKQKFGRHNIGNKYNNGRVPCEKTREAQLLSVQRPIIQYSIDNKYLDEFKSVVEAAEKTGVSSSTIIKIAKGRSKRPRLYIFKYKQ